MRLDKPARERLQAGCCSTYHLSPNVGRYAHRAARHRRSPPRYRLPLDRSVRRLTGLEVKATLDAELLRVQLVPLPDCETAEKRDLA